MNRSDMDTVLQVVAHDLRNPLSCIEGYARLLLEEGTDPERRETFARRIISSSMVAESMIADLLDASVIERGPLSVTRAPLPVRGLLAEAVENFEVLCRQRGVSLTYLPSAVPVQVLGDRKRLLQVLNNLLSNALRHVRPKVGAITVSARFVDGDVSVEVRDNGEGIEPEHQAAVFDRYYQVSDSRRGSLGLGLFIAKGVIEAHGGSITVLSDGRGRGAAFRFTLPAYDPERAYRGMRDLRPAPTPAPRRPAGDILEPASRAPFGWFGFRFGLASLAVAFAAIGTAALWTVM